MCVSPLFLKNTLLIINQAVPVEVSEPMGGMFYAVGLEFFTNNDALSYLKIFQFHCFYIIVNFYTVHKFYKTMLCSNCTDRRKTGDPTYIVLKFFFF